MISFDLNQKYTATEPCKTLNTKVIQTPTTTHQT